MPDLKQAAGRVGDKSLSEWSVLKKEKLVSLPKS